MKLLHWANALNFPVKAITEKFAFLGQSGSGKTYAALKLAEEMLAVGAQVITVDPVGVHWGLRVSASGKRKGIPIAVFGGDHGDLPLLPEHGKLVAEVLASRGISAILDVSEFTMAELKRFAADFAEAFFQTKKKHRSAMHIMLEEAQLFVPQNPEPDEGKMLNRFERLFKLGRNYGLGWSLISQQPQAVNKRVLNQASTVVALRMLAKHEKKAIVDWVSDKVSKQEELDLVNDLPSLETGTAHVWSPSFLKVSKQVKVLKRWTFDSSSTPEFGSKKKGAKHTSLLADVDLAKLRTELQAMVVEAEKSDVKALQKQVEKLHYELQVQTRLVKHTATEYELRLKKAEQNMKTKEVPVLTEKQLKRLEKAVDKLKVVCEVARASVVDISQALHEQKVHEQKVLLPGQLPVLGTTQIGQDARNVQLKHHFVTGLQVVKEPAQHEPLRDSHGNPIPIKKGAREMLIALSAQQRPISRKQLATLVGMSASSGTSSSYLSALRSAGYTVEDRGYLMLSATGRTYLGQLARQVPHTTEELVQLWSRHLKAGARRMLNELVAHRQLSGAGWYDRESLANVVGMALGSGTFSSYLSSLRSGGLIEENHNGLRASDTLFP